MKKLLLFLSLAVASEGVLADVVMETPVSTGSSVSDLLLLAGVAAIAALLFVRYRRARQKH
jgi:LPXTG-motif cell wall-anchored protein